MVVRQVRRNVRYSEDYILIGVTGAPLIKVAYVQLIGRLTN
jgi:hypothetical protein